MGKRLQPRVQGILPVRIWGNDDNGLPFSEHVCTRDISNKGVCLVGVRALLSSGNTVGLQYRNRQSRFRVTWVAPSEGQGQNVGLECMQPEKDLWPVATPTEGRDPYSPEEARSRRERALEARRAHPRFPVSGAARVRGRDGNRGHWAKLGDLSLTGCYLQTAEPLEVGRSVALLVKVGNREFEAAAIVRSSWIGTGMGLEFTFLTNPDRATLCSVIGRLRELDTLNDKAELRR